MKLFLRRGVAALTFLLPVAYADQPIQANLEPLVISSTVQASFEKYASYPNAMNFFVNRAGTRTIWFQCEQAMCSDDDSGMQALRCKWAGMPDCILYASRGKVVYKGPVTIAGVSRLAQLQRNQPVVQEQVAPFENSDQPRRGVFYWQDIGNKEASFAGNPGSDSGTIQLDLPSGTCTGSYKFSGLDGNWSLTCPSQLTASGTVTSLGKNKLIQGSGLDSQNHKINLVVPAL